jgi:predicted nucleic acid-binding Zn ribbon protein
VQAASRIEVIVEPREVVLVAAAAMEQDESACSRDCGRSFPNGRISQRSSTTTATEVHHSPSVAASRRVCESDAETATTRSLSDPRMQGDDAAARRQDWMSEELPFLAVEKPWERADVIVAGAGLQAGEPSDHLYVASSRQTPPVG